MNEALQEYARNKLKEDLKKCTPEQQHFFKKMYSHKNLDLSIEGVVDFIPESRLDWAMQQVRKTIEKKLKGALS